MQFFLFSLLSLKLRFEEMKDKERGATGVEYGLLVALIAGAIILVVTTLGTDIRDAFQDVVDAI